MPDLLQRGSEWLDQVMKEKVSQSITYHRGGATCELVATVGLTEFITETTEGIVDQKESRDYIFLAADLTLAGEVLEPKRFDLIKETSQDGTIYYVYEVASPEDRPVWRWSDDLHRTRRVHTKFIGTEPVT